MNFLCTGISPLGVAGAGILISAMGLTKSLVLMGGGLILLNPLLLLIPKLRGFLGADAKEVEEFFARNYPGAF
jgi:hypothetical protein